jgi:hypothetical protein
VLGDSCVCHLLLVLLSYVAVLVAVLFRGFPGLKCLFMAMCLTLIDYFIFLCGSVILCILISTNVEVLGILLVM